MIVARNEELNLSYLLNDIMNQTYSHNLIDIILVDSMSEDNTRKIMENYQTISDFNSVLILENSEKILAEFSSISTLLKSDIVTYTRKFRKNFSCWMEFSYPKL